MKRSKKSLCNAILVSFLSASMMMTTPVYAVEYSGANVKIETNVDDGVSASGKSDVTIKGTVLGNTSRSDFVDASGGSSITIDGNAEAPNKNISATDGSSITVINGNVIASKTSINNGSSLTVKGNVDASSISAFDKSNISIDGKVNTESLMGDEKSNLTVKGDVNTVILANDHGNLKIDGNVDGDSFETYTGTSSITGSMDGVVYVEGGSTVNIGKDVISDDNGAVVVQSRKDDGDNATTNLNIGGNIKFDEDKSDERAGLSVGGEAGTEVNVNVKGKISVGANKAATGIESMAGTDGLAPNDTSGEKTTVHITAGSVTATIPKEGEDTRMATAISVSNGNNADTQIEIKGDVTSTGTSVSVQNTGDASTTNIVVDGTLDSANHNTIVVVNNKDGKNTVNITAWQLKSTGHNSVNVNTAEKNLTNCTYDKEETEKLAKNINYIIRHEGTISLDGTRTITTFNGNSYETAHENEKLTIHVKVDDDKKYRVDRVEGGTATATKNADGSWTLTVPKNGGVDIRAVLVAIEQKESSSSSSSSGSSSSGGGSSSSHPGSSNAASGMTTTTTDGATVQTNVAKNNNSTTTAAAVRIGTSTAKVTSSVSEQNGTKVTFQNATGNLAGASFKTVGQISADGTTLVKEDGTTAKMATGMLLAIENADGTSIGCFVDSTGKVVATGSYEVYYMLGTDGKLHAHFVNPQGYFMTGIQVINGKTVTFNAVGEMVSVQ